VLKQSPKYTGATNLRVLTKPLFRSKRHGMIRCVFIGSSYRLGALTGDQAANARKNSRPNRWLFSG